MSSPYPINHPVTGAWSKVLDKIDLFRYGHLIADGTDMEVAWSGAPAPADIAYLDAGGRLLYGLVGYKELWVRGAGGTGTGTLGGELITVPPGMQGPLGIFDSLVYRGHELIDYIGSAGTNLILVDAGGLGDFTSIQAAITSATAGDTVLVNPGTYTENVIQKRGVAIRGRGAMFGPRMDTVITSASGDTLQVPHRDCCINGISIQSTSPNPADAALRIIDDGLGVGLETFIINFHAGSMSGAQAQAVHCDALPPNENAIFIYAGIDADASAPIAVEIDAAFLVWFLGGMGGNGAQVGVKLNPGAGFMAGAEAGINADLVAGRAIEMDGGFFLGLNCTIDGFNGVRGQNGSTIVLSNAKAFGGFAGTPLDTDVTSFTLLGASALEGFGAPAWQGFSVLGPTARMFGGVEGAGTTAGPDQRPTATGSNPPVGFQYWALDLAPGGGPGVGSLLMWNGVGWIDMTGAVIP